ncbi:MAG: hypothetical protein ABMB14_28185 [Myxococcota bacterium]
MTSWLVVGMLGSDGAAAAPPDFDVAFTGCTEFAGIGFVPAANAAPLVPAGYTLAGDGIDAIVVVRVADCAGVSIDGKKPKAGTVAQIGVTIVGPDATADIDNYTLWYVTDSGALHGKLTAAGLDNDVDPHLSYTVDPATDSLTADADPPHAPDFALDADVVPPTSPAVPFVARWWAETCHGTLEMRTELPQIAFGGATSTVVTSAGSPLAALIGDTSLTFAILDSYNTFATADMTVTVQ